MSFLIAVAALALLMFVAYRGFSVILFAPIAAMLAVLLTDPAAVPPVFTGVFMVCRACSTAWRWKSSTQPDGGEGLAKRKGVAVRRGLKEAWSKTAARWTRTGYEAYPAGRAGTSLRSPGPSRAGVVDPAGVRRRRSSLPREISVVFGIPD